MSLRGCIAAAALIVAGCGCGSPPEQAAASGTTPTQAPAWAPPTAAPQPHRAETIAERLDALDAAVGGWRNAHDLATARRNAEAARNLIVGRAGPFHGDADGDGEIAGSSDPGLLPGLGGQPGLASSATNACVTRDVLGGGWSDPAGRWQILRTAIANWKPTRNTFPTLPSHPQRVVGWATLALAADDLATARDYARHAQLHVDISQRALRQCAY